MFSKALGRAIKLARNDKGWSQETLAAKVGLSVSQISRFERGERRPHADEVRNIAEALGVLDLVSGSDLSRKIYERIKDAPAEMQTQVLKIVDALLSSS